MVGEYCGGISTNQGSAERKEKGAIMAQGTAKELVTLWETKVENMLGGNCDVELLENLVKAAKIAGKPEIKFLAFKNVSRNNKKILNVLAEPADKYVKPSGAAKTSEKPRSTW